MQLIVNLCEHFGWTVAEVGPLTPTQAIALCEYASGNGGRKQKSDAEGFIQAFKSLGA